MCRLLILDKIYGEFEVDKVLEELILSKPIQRLKRIHQGGASYLVNEKWNVTLYDHSIGVMLLIRMLGGSVQEQIAGLLHDVSHTAFSHVVDFVFENKEEDYHEKIFSRVIRDSEIPTILAKYDYNFEEILFDDSKWTLLEQPASELCADRIDSTLRDMYQYEKINFEEINHFLSNLIVVEGKIYLQSIEIAEWFVRTYYKEVIDFFMDPLNMYGNDILAMALKTALDKGLINLEDFLLEDEKLIYLMKSSKNQKVQGYLKQLHQNVLVIEDRIDYDMHRKTKVRLIDPLILRGNEKVKASILSETIRALGDSAKEKSLQGVYVKVISN